MDLKEFLNSPIRNVWIEEPGIGIYVRKSIRIGVDIDLANMEADEPGKGALTLFLDKYEPHHVFCVEGVLNPRLVPYLVRRGYLQLAGNEGAVNMVSSNYWECK